MGCDIHAHIEQRFGDRWEHRARLHLWRNYSMFGLLAGVRRDGCLYPPRGFPENASWGTRYAYTMKISEVDCGCEDVTTPERVARFSNTNMLGSRLVDPDHHTPSHLTLEEYGKALSKYAGYECVEQPYEYCGAWAHMWPLEQSGRPTRLVFWFDN